jgi:copper chaperone CopZ
MKYRIKIQIGGIHCAGCFNQIDRVIRSLDASMFDLDLSRMIETIEYQGEASKAETFCAALRKAGFPNTLLSQSLLEE